MDFDLNMEKNKATYFSQLDTLRAIAVILVIVSHWFNHDHFFNRYLPNGVLGVTLFFVLSGFLITQILLKSKAGILNKTFTVFTALKIFYIRRSLRIFPLYYFVLLLVLIFPLVPLVNSFPWHLLYASNIYFWKEAHFQAQLSHLWSLSVEEQFYIFWPAIILLIPTNKLPYLFLAGIFLAIGFRYFFYTQNDSYGRLLMPCSLDSFCIGALLAYGCTFVPTFFQLFSKYAVGLLYASCTIFLLVTFTNVIGHSKLFFETVYYTGISLLFMQFIYFAVNSVNNKYVALLLNSSLLQYLGKISYGLYVYHNFIPYLYDVPLPNMLQSLSLYIVQLLRFVLLIGVASLSWYLLEKPILKIKDKFNLF